MTKVEYIKLFGEKGIQDVFYTCKICQKVVLCQQICIVNHLENCHQVSLQEYTDTYENGENKPEEKQIQSSELDPLDFVETEKLVESADQQLDHPGDEQKMSEDENDLEEEEEEEEMSIIPEDDDYFQMSIEEEDDILVANLSANKEDETTGDSYTSDHEKGDETSNDSPVVDTDSENIKGNLSTEDIRNIFDTDSDG